MTIINFTAVETSSPQQVSNGPCLGFGIRYPNSNDPVDAYAFMIEGWVLGRNSPATVVELVHGEASMVQMPVNLRRPDVQKSFPQAPGSERPGFRTLFNALRLPLQFEVELRAVFADGNRFSIGKIRGQRQPVRSEKKPAIQPLLLTTLGRSGSTWLSLLLGKHPQVIVYEPFAFEPRVLSYWMVILSILSKPQSYYSMLIGDLAGDYWWAGDRVQIPFQPQHEYHGVQHWLSKEHIEQLVAFSQDRIDSTYQVIAQTEGGKKPDYFMEKLSPHHAMNPLIWELYPSAREIILVRDFRDMLCSVLAYNHKKGYATFGREKVDTDEEYVRYLAGNSANLLRCWKRHKAKSFLLRYEDLILSPLETLGSLFNYLGVDSNTSTIEQILQASSEDKLKVQSHHQTSKGPRESIGRWRRDLTPALQGECQKAFASVLQEFGYSVE